MKITKDQNPDSQRIASSVCVAVSRDWRDFLELGESLGLSPRQTAFAVANAYLHMAAFIAITSSPIDTKTLKANFIRISDEQFDHALMQSARGTAKGGPQ